MGDGAFSAILARMIPTPPTTPPAIAKRTARRALLRDGLHVLGLMALAGWFGPALAQSARPWNRAAFEAQSLNEVVRLLGGAPPVASGAIQIRAADIAENAAQFPVTLSSGLPDTDEIALLVEKNPNLLAAHFLIPPGTEPEIATRIKLAQAGPIFAVVRAGGRYYFARREIQVTQGGCG
ncbi:MAG: hypothetical protein IOMNBAOH_02320 [Rhodocyclaceae bacterium]|jgi:sulfur-oxidizing protein SoxY|nr:hypothetical protein [Rhodocyclaceae bacterium]